MNRHAAPLEFLNRARPLHRVRGMSLIMVMLILVIVSLLGIGGIQISMMAERSARNDRNSQIAWQSAEVGLLDGELDMSAPGPATRAGLFDASNATVFISGCGSSGTAMGLCASVTAGKPAWLTANFTNPGTTFNTTAMGAFTGRTFMQGSVGVQPARAPRYVIEPVVDQLGSKSPDDQTLAYRVTAMGFGPRADVQAVVQSLYRK